MEYSYFFFIILNCSFFFPFEKSLQLGHFCTHNYLFIRLFVFTFDNYSLSVYDVFILYFLQFSYPVEVDYKRALNTATFHARRAVARQKESPARAAAVGMIIGKGGVQ